MWNVVYVDENSVPFHYQVGHESRSKRSIAGLDGEAMQVTVLSRHKRYALQGESDSRAATRCNVEAYSSVLTRVPSERR